MELRARCENDECGHELAERGWRLTDGDELTPAPCPGCGQPLVLRVAGAEELALTVERWTVRTVVRLLKARQERRAAHTVEGWWARQQAGEEATG